jgi:hypothetical protein
MLEHEHTGINPPQSAHGLDGGFGNGKLGLDEQNGDQRKPRHYGRSIGPNTA